MIPYVDYSASQKRGRKDGPGAARHVYRHPCSWESVRLRAIEPEQPQSGYRAAGHPKFAAYAGSRLASSARTRPPFSASSATRTSA